MTQYCPHTTTCPFYQNWEEQTKDRRIDVIIEFIGGEGKSFYYDCRPLMALKDSATGIPIIDRLRDTLPDSKGEKFGCSHITLLNLFTKLDKKLK